MNRSGFLGTDKLDIRPGFHAKYEYDFPLTGSRHFWPDEEMSKSVVFVIRFANPILDYSGVQKSRMTSNDLPKEHRSFENNPYPDHPPIRARDVTFWFSDNFESAIIVKLIARLPDNCLIVDLSKEKQTLTLKQWYDSPEGFKFSAHAKFSLTPSQTIYFEPFPSSSQKSSSLSKSISPYGFPSESKRTLFNSIRPQVDLNLTSNELFNLPVTVISEEIEIIGLALRTTAISFAPTIRSGWPSLSKSMFPYTVTQILIFLMNLYGVYK